MSTRRNNALWYATALPIAAVIVVILWLYAPAPTPPKPLVSAYYVWQMQWNDDVRAAVREADASANLFMVLVGEVNASGGDLRLQRGYPDWGALSKVRAPITAVLRANAAVADLLQGDARNKAVDFVANALESVIAEARARGATVRGVQLDYDCPSAKLASYKALVDALQPRFEGLEFSITALPTWLKWGDFATLVRGLSYYVLQVHSLDPPSFIDKPITLCETSRIPGYLRRAASIGTPYYLALPTYGYRFIFDTSGKFASIAAEGPAPVLKPGYHARTVMADPAEIAGTVRAVRAHPPHGLLGFAWFRLPIVSDELNWSWRTLEAVRAGRAPSAAFDAELRTPNPGLYELYIANTGETEPANGVRTTVRFASGSVLASDTHNGFTSDKSADAMNLSGPAPRPGRTVLAAWFRMKPSEVATNAPPIRVDPIEPAPAP